MVIAIGYGATFTWDGDPVGELTRIGTLSITVSKQDSTNLAPANAFKTILPGLLDPGNVELEGFFSPGDTGQVGMLADFLARPAVVKAFIIAFPTAISTSTWTGNAYITAFATDEITAEGIVPWSATISITGKPTLGVTLSAGMTVLVAQEQTGTANIPYSPACAVGTYNYMADAVINTASTWVKLTVTAAGVITATCLGVEHVLTTTVLSEAIAVGAATTVTPIYIKVQEALKSARNYTLWINRT